MKINKEKRIIYYEGPIEGEDIEEFNFELIQMINNSSKKKTKPIKIYINSFGGELFSAFSIINIIENSEVPIYTYCTGYAHSAAFLIFLAGHKRYAYKHSNLLYHQIAYGIDTQNIKKILILNDNMVYSQKEMEKYVLEKTNMPKSLIKKIRKEHLDYYLRKEDFERYGICELIKK